MRSFYVKSVPMPLVIGGWSYGTHVHTTTPERAEQCAREIGYEPVAVNECPDTFTCTCQEDARKEAHEPTFVACGQCGHSFLVQTPEVAAEVRNASVEECAEWHAAI